MPPWPTDGHDLDEPYPPPEERSLIPTKEHMVRLHATAQKLKLFALGLAARENQQRIDLDFVNKYLFRDKTYAERQRQGPVTRVPTIDEIWTRFERHGGTSTFHDKLPVAYTAHFEIAMYVIMKDRALAALALTQGVPPADVCFEFVKSCLQVYTYRVVHKKGMHEPTILQLTRDEFIFRPLSEEPTDERKWKRITNTAAFTNSAQLFDTWLEPRTAFMCTVRAILRVTDEELKEMRDELLALISRHINIYPQRLVSTLSKDENHWIVNLNMLDDQPEFKEPLIEQILRANSSTIEAGMRHPDATSTSAVRYANLVPYRPPPLEDLRGTREASLNNLRQWRRRRQIEFQQRMQLQSRAIVRLQRIDDDDIRDRQQQQQQQQQERRRRRSESTSPVERQSNRRRRLAISSSSSSSPPPAPSPPRPPSPIY